jgi:hypothetical protein
MIYLPQKTYREISALDLRYNALLKELSLESREIKKLQEQAASFDENESMIARGKLRRILKSIIQLRGQAQDYARPTF